MRHYIKIVALARSEKPCWENDRRAAKWTVSKLENREDSAKLANPRLCLEQLENWCVVLHKIRQMPELFQPRRGAINEGCRLYWQRKSSSWNRRCTVTPATWNSRKPPSYATRFSASASSDWAIRLADAGRRTAGKGAGPYPTSIARQLRAPLRSPHPQSHGAAPPLADWTCARTTS